MGIDLNEAIVKSLKFEEPCWNCYRGGPKDDPCDTCGGSGFLTTELGDKVLELLKHEAIRQRDKKPPEF